jgi:hypothetical protein
MRQAHPETFVDRRHLLRQIVERTPTRHVRIL